MGAAPSAETLRTAPFCPMRKGSRQLALLPFTQEFFPGPKSPLFVQLYEAYMDSSVRYYIRREGGTLLQDRIPPIAFTIQELYARYVAVSSASYFPSNQALREEVEAGRGYRVRPTPCAVVFLYEGSGPEGCVRVSKQKNMQIRVIGAVGDALCEPSTTPIVLRESDVFRYQIFITKSAGDHNLVRVQLIAAYVYQYQCLELIGLREVPFLPTTMLTLKTNIPFLCFFRELRGRTHSLWSPSTALSMWVDAVCLRVSASADSMRAICDAFFQHFMIIKEKKANHRKLRQQKGEKDLRKKLLTASLTEVCSFSSLTDSCEENGAPAPAENSVPLNHAIAMSNKVTYQLMGYIVSDQASIVAECSAPNEVYVACVDSVVQVVALREETGRAAAASLSKGVSLTAAAIREKMTASEPCAGDDVCGKGQTTFSTVDTALLSSEVTAVNPVKVLHTLSVKRGDILSFAPSTDYGKEAEPSSCRGIWRVDPSIFMECILLSLVRDECKRAREAGPDDPNWVRDPITQRVVHQDSFYIWRFCRGPEVFFYGTVPKFANPKQGASASRAGPSHVGTLLSVEHGPDSGATTAGEAGALSLSLGSSLRPTSRRVPPRYGESSPPLYQGPPAPLAVPFLYEVKPQPAYGAEPTPGPPTHHPLRGPPAFQILPIATCGYDAPPPPLPLSLPAAPTVMSYALLKGGGTAPGPQPVLYAPSGLPNGMTAKGYATTTTTTTTSAAAAGGAAGSGGAEGYAGPTYYCVAPAMSPYFTTGTVGMSSGGGAYPTFLSHQLPMQVVMLQPPSQ